MDGIEESTGDIVRVPGTLLLVVPGIWACLVKTFGHRCEFFSNRLMLQHCLAFIDGLYYTREYETIRWARECGSLLRIATPHDNVTGRQRQGT